MMLLGIDWFVVEDSRRKAAINVLFLCEMVVSLYVVGFCFMDFVLCTIYMMYIYPYPFFFLGK